MVYYAYNYAYKILFFKFKNTKCGCGIKWNAAILYAWWAGLKKIKINEHKTNKKTFSLFC